MTMLVDELANELRQYRHSAMASGALAEHILAIPRIHDALAETDALRHDLERAVAREAELLTAMAKGQPA